MEGPDVKSAEAVIDNGKFGTRTIRFETGLLARQAAGYTGLVLMHAHKTAKGQPVERDRSAAPLTQPCQAGRVTETELFHVHARRFGRQQVAKLVHKDQ